MWLNLSMWLLLCRNGLWSSGIKTFTSLLLQGATMAALLWWCQKVWLLKESLFAVVKWWIGFIIFHGWWIMLSNIIGNFFSSRQSFGDKTGFGIYLCYVLYIPQVIQSSFESHYVPEMKWLSWLSKCFVDSGAVGHGSISLHKLLSVCCQLWPCVYFPSFFNLIF